MLYQVGDKIVHPLHGAGIIDRMETRRIDGVNRKFYVMNLPNNQMTVMIPVDSCDKVGVRNLCSSEEIDSVLNDIPNLVVDTNENWNKRYRENMLRIKSGNLRELASVIKSLVLRDDSRGLSTGERKMLVSSKQIILTEISFVKNISYEEAEANLLRHVRSGKGS